SAMRMATSRVRRLTEYAITPYNPTAARISASAPNAPTAMAPSLVGATVVAATSVAEASSVNWMFGSRLRIACRRVGSDCSAGVWVRTTSPTVCDGASGSWRYGRGDSPTDRILWSREMPTISYGEELNVP